MKSSALIHLIWLVVAGAAFAIGWTVKSNKDDTSSSATLGGALLSNQEGGDGSTGGQGVGAGDGQSAFGQVSSSGDVSSYLDANGVMTAGNMRQAMRDALNESDPLKANILFSQLLQELTAENVDEALAVIEEAPQGWDTWQKLGLFVGAWGAIDGPKALEYAKKMNGPGRFFGPAAALGGWAATDPDAAVEHLNNSEMDQRQKIAGQAGIIRGMAINDPDKATKYLEGLPADTEGMARLVEVLANEQMKKGAKEATDWAASLATDELKEDAFSRLSNEYSRQDPVQASTWIADYADKAYAVDAVAEVADEWAEIDPRSAVGWASTLPDVSQGEAMENAFEEWAESDPKGASEYLYDMEASPTRDAAVSGFVSDLGREDPESAIQWAKTIEDPQMQTEALASVARDWYRTDKEAAAVWLPDSGLPAETVEQITKPQSNMAEMFRRMRDGGGFGN